jgi:osmoprotectant transport system substrate-binding protein
VIFRTTSSRRFALRTAGAVVVLASVASACGSSSGSSASTTIALPQRVIVTRIGTDKESELLAALYSQALQNAGLRVARKDAVSDRATAYSQLESDAVQVVPEYSGDFLAYLQSTGATPSTTTPPSSTATASTVTASNAVANTLATVPGASIPEITTTTAEPLPTGTPRTIDEQMAVIRSLLPPTVSASTAANAERKQVIACSSKAVNAHTLGTYTDLGVAAADLVLGGPAGFDTSTPMGLASLKDTYAATFKSFVPLADDKIDASVKAGTIDCAVLSSVSPVVAGETMTILLDDKALVSPNGAFALISTPGATSGVTAAINAVTAKLTTQVLANMMNEIISKGTSPEEIASLYLQQS